MSMYNKKFLIVVLALVIVVSFIFYFVTKPDSYNKDDLYENKIADHNQNYSNKKYGVATNNPIAQRVGEKIISDGGNAVDAAIGVSYALAVTEPHSSGIGGGGAMLTYDGKENDEPNQYQYKDISSYDYKQGDQIGTPGFVKGMHDVHEKEGKMDEKDILNRVIPLAKDGFEIDSELERSLKLFGDKIDRDTPFFNDEKTKRQGDVVKQPELAKTLEGIRDHGPDYFYDKVGKSISKQLDDKLTEKDFKDYKPEQKDPVSTTYLNNKVYSASNPLGGTLMLQGLKIDESVNDSPTLNDRDDFIQNIIDARDLMYRNRDIVNGNDADYSQYLSQDYISGELQKIKAGNGFDNSFSNDIETMSTTHFVVIDKQGKMASTTNTLSSFFGSGKFMKEGFYMNDSLSNFSQSEASPNHGEPHKQPRSFTAPSIVVGPDFYLGIGTPGGNKIPTTENEVLIDYLRGQGTLQQSIDKPRFYNDGDTVYYENAMKKSDIETFERMGYQTEEKRNDPNFGSIQAASFNKKDKRVEIGHDVGNR
ncbi:gamma-glutamyltransferase [Staphylococcus argensis]|uniref:Gamma-glutamyltranspeptidase n=1 Tax=Staphylococcus argensis TaxID=1607738 RepID=A0A2K4FCB8_9STAP|nr:gamma-glutamyltransferase [Staphylococcus argensis]MCY6991612.1 gamma-glutamyltransferase [Staphylococcus argensis]POA09008.1 gamma-glutamyltranspeptidase [Staphylococcus argensis]